MDNKRKRGFTLIEIMVVVVIVGLLAALVGPEVWRMLGFGQVGVAETKCKYYYDRAHFWELQKKKLPDSLEEMEAPLKPGEEDFLQIEDDPWGNKYVLERDGKRIIIWCWGPDGQEGTDDDIRYPPEKE
jgi:general secretion pathway protein G